MSSLPISKKSPKGPTNNRETTLNRQDLLKGGRQTTAKSPGTHSADSTLNRPSALKRQLMKMNGMTK